MIGVFDSGVGGLTVYKAVKKLLPDEQFVYLGDTARSPYGTKDDSTIIHYTQECFETLKSFGVSLIIIACNTASSLALEIVRSQSSLPVIGTIECAVNAVTQEQREKIALIGTEATIRSGAYQRKLKEALPHSELFCKACPLFVPLVEEGILEGTLPQEAVKYYLDEVRLFAPSAVVLACTHYPLLKKAISQFLGEEVAIIDCADEIALEVARSYQNPSQGRSNSGDKFFVTDGKERFQRIAERFLETSLEVHQIQLRSLL